MKKKLITIYKVNRSLRQSIMRQIPVQGGSWARLNKHKTVTFGKLFKTNENLILEFPRVYKSYNIQNKKKFSE